MNKLRAAAYCRVSTDRAEQSGSLASQRSFFDDYIRNSDSMTLVGVFYDEGTSGTTTLNRYGFNKMISLAVSGGIDIILTKEVSRFARNTVDTLNITRMLRAKGVGIIFINDNIDTRDSDGELRLSIMATIAQEESRKISERVKWGQQRKMEQGVVFGRSCLGYDVKDGKITVNADSAEIVKRIFTEYTVLLKGAESIADELNAEQIRTVNGGRWSGAFIRKVLRNVKYVGDLEQKKTCTPDFLTHKKRLNSSEHIYIRNHHEPIISRELWEQTQAEISRRKPTDTSRHSDRYVFSGKVYCGVCGSVMVSRVKTLKNGKIYHALRCSGRIGGKSCNNETLNVTALKACVKRIFTDIPIDKTAVINAVIKGLSRTDKPDIPALRRKIETLNAKKRRAVDLMLDGLITQQELIEQKSYYDSIIEKLSQEISSDRSIFETDKIRKNAEKFLDFTSDPIWLLVIRADYIHGTLTVYLNGIEKGFTACFTATGRGGQLPCHHGKYSEVARDHSGNDAGTEELSHLEMIGSIVSQLTTGEGAKSFDRYGVGAYYMDHANAVYPSNAGGVPFTAAYIQSKADPLADIHEDLAAEQKARATYDNILRVCDDPDVSNVIKFLREREVVHFQRFGEVLDILQSQIK